MQRLQYFLCCTLKTSSDADIANHKASVYKIFSITSEKCCDAAFDWENEITAP